MKQDYYADSEGSQVVYESLAQAAAIFREIPAGASLPDDWSAEIEADYKKRGGKRIASK